MASVYTYENHGVLVPDLILPYNSHFKASSFHHVNDILLSYIVCDKQQVMSPYQLHQSLQI